jgi:hypothetical protein
VHGRFEIRRQETGDEDLQHSCRSAAAFRSRSGAGFVRFPILILHGEHRLEHAGRGKQGLRVDLHREYPWNYTRRATVRFGLTVPREEREFIPWPRYQRMKGVQLTADRFAGLRF